MHGRTATVPAADPAPNPTYGMAAQGGRLSRGQRIFNVLLGMITAALVLPFVVLYTRELATTVARAGDPVTLAKWIYWYLLNNVRALPAYFAGLVVVFALQWIRPVDRAQGAFSPAVRTDILYSVVMFAFYATVAPAYLGWLKALATDVVPSMEIVRADVLPPVAQIVVGYLAVDFLGWLHHLVRHKVPLFWAFHAVHHSQEELNPFSNERVHLLDWFVANLVKFLPAFFFTESMGIVLNYIVIHKFLDHLNHANVRTNLGPLRYVFVTPQSHRIHHAVEREYFDLNYGVSLSLWDHLFGTQCRDYEVYPATGIPDRSYPSETALGSGGVVRSFLRQQVYPFRKIRRYFD
ncbi:MAG: sterol desaturase family protein [Vicinamibacterales bacterium]